MWHKIVERKLAPLRSLDLLSDRGIGKKPILTE